MMNNVSLDYLEKTQQPSLNLNIFDLILEQYFEGYGGLLIVYYSCCNV